MREGLKAMEAAMEDLDERFRVEMKEGSLEKRLVRVAREKRSLIVRAEVELWKLRKGL